MKKIILSAFILTLIFSSCDFFQSKNLFSDDEDTLMLYQKKQDSLRFVDSIKKLQKQLSSVRQRHKTMLDSIKKSQGPQAKKSQYKFHIIVGSFRNQEYLQSYNQFIKDKGFKTTILKNQYGFRLISIESTNSWRSAVSTLEDIRNDLEKNAWIYIES
jgi:hypothetical protein